jgi:hypothetical protein
MDRLNPVAKHLGDVATVYHRPKLQHNGRRSVKVKKIESSNKLVPKAPSG